METQIIGLNEYVSGVYASLKRAVSLKLTSIVISDALKDVGVVDKYNLEFKNRIMSTQLNQFPNIWVPSNLRDLIAYSQKNNIPRGSYLDSIPLLDSDFMGLLNNDPHVKEKLGIYNSIFRRNWKKEDFKDKGLMKRIFILLPGFYDQNHNQLRNLSDDLQQKIYEYYKPEQLKNKIKDNGYTIEHLGFNK